MNISSYLERIGYTGDLKPHLALLRELQKKHIRSIPFENLDIHMGNKITLDIEKVYAKIILTGRGGFCYENNGLFFFLLDHLGFRVKRISARVFSEEKGYGQEFDHLAILCSLDQEQYLLDVGFGDFAEYPLKLSLDKVQTDPRGKFKILEHEGSFFQVQSKKGETWKPVYIFSQQSRAYGDFEGMCHFHQTSPDSPFTRKKLCTRATENGRITLLNDKLVIQEGELRQEIKIENEADFQQKLKQHFHIDISEF